MEAIFTSLIFACLLSGFAWYLTGVAIERSLKDSTREKEQKNEKTAQHMCSVAIEQVIENQSYIPSSLAKHSTRPESEYSTGFRPISGRVSQAKSVLKPDPVFKEKAPQKGTHLQRQTQRENRPETGTNQPLINTVLPLQNGHETLIQIEKQIVIKSIIDPLPTATAVEEKRYCLTCKKWLPDTRPPAKYCNASCKREC